MYSYSSFPGDWNIEYCIKILYKREIEWKRLTCKDLFFFSSPFLLFIDCHICLNVAGKRNILFFFFFLVRKQTWGINLLALALIWLVFYKMVLLYTHLNNLCAHLEGCRRDSPLRVQKREMYPHLLCLIHNY